MPRCRRQLGGKYVSRPDIRVRGTMRKSLREKTRKVPPVRRETGAAQPTGKGSIQHQKTLRSPSKKRCVNKKVV